MESILRRESIGQEQVDILRSTRGNNGYDYVLAHLFERTNPQEWATWEEHEQGYFHAGHYFINLEDAIRDYEERIS